MRVGAQPLHLTYCSNIHPADGWAQVLANLRRYAPALKQALSPRQAFGLGLRLSAREAEELLGGESLEEFREFLTDHGLYVFTLNGFPYGPFFGRTIKSGVFEPDWCSEARLRYTLALAEILKRLLMQAPEGTEGSISTLPLSYKPWFEPADRTPWETSTRHLVRVTEYLARVHTDTGAFIHLDLEPEPDGLMEDSDGVVRFYRDWLLPAGAPLLAKTLNVSREEAESHLLQHVRVCLDTCHLAVEYEDPDTVLRSLQAAGIRVGKVQIGCALRAPLAAGPVERDREARELAAFAESTYLHQVIARDRSGRLRRYRDLPDALPHIRESELQEWRIHFHVPVFVDRYRSFLSTQDTTRQVLQRVAETGFSRHLEIETYTWEVLPAELKTELADSIEREYRWVLGVLNRQAHPWWHEST